MKIRATGGSSVALVAPAFDFHPLLPPPVANGLTSISRANCLRRQPSFRPADVHLFGIGNPRSGQGIGGCLLTFFGTSKESKAASGAATPESTEIYGLFAGCARQAPYFS